MANVVEIAIRAHDFTDRAFASARRNVGNLARGMVRQMSDAFSTAGEALSSGLGGGLKVAFSNPYTATAAAAGIAVLSATLAPILALAIGGALTLALGGAFVGVGAMLLMQNDKIKKQFSDTFGEVKKIATSAFEPLIPVLDTVRETALRVTKAFAPFIEAASAQVAPHLQNFIKNLGDAAIELAPALGPLMDAFGKILDEIGPELPGLFSSMASALTTLFEAVGDNAEGFSTMIVVVIHAINGLIVVIGWLINQIEFNVKAFNYLKEMGQKAWESISDSGSKMMAKIRSVGRTIGALKGKTVRIAQTGASSVISWVSRVIGWIRRFVGKTVRIGVNGVSGAINAVRNLIGWISNLTGKIVNVGVNILRGALPGFAHGGIIGAAGGGPRSGWTMVGESGRELVQLAAGSRVIPNGQTERMLASGANAVSVQLEWVGTQAGDALFEWIKENIRIRVGGGTNSVQRALGSV